MTRRYFTGYHEALRDAELREQEAADAYVAALQARLDVLQARQAGQRAPRHEISGRPAPRPTSPADVAWRQQRASGMHVADEPLHPVVAASRPERQVYLPPTGQLAREVFGHAVHKRR